MPASYLARTRAHTITRGMVHTGPWTGNPHNTRAEATRMCPSSIDNPSVRALLYRSNLAWPPLAKPIRSHVWSLDFEFADTPYREISLCAGIVIGSQKRMLKSDRVVGRGEYWHKSRYVIRIT